MNQQLTSTKKEKKRKKTINKNEPARHFPATKQTRETILSEVINENNKCCGQETDKKRKIYQKVPERIQVLLHSADRSTNGLRKLKREKRGRGKNRKQSEGRKIACGIGKVIQKRPVILL